MEHEIRIPSSSFSFIEASTNHLYHAAKQKLNILPLIRNATLSANEAKENTKHQKGLSTISEHSPT